VLAASYVGVRVDDGTTSNSVELRVQATASANDIEYRTTLGGVLTVATVFTGLVPQWWKLFAGRSGTAVSATFGINTPIGGIAGSTAGHSWTATRAGITFGQRGIASNSNRAGFFDWARIA